MEALQGKPQQPAGGQHHPGPKFKPYSKLSKRSDGVGLGVGVWVGVSTGVTVIVGVFVAVVGGRAVGKTLKSGDFGSCGLLRLLGASSQKNGRSAKTGRTAKSNKTNSFQ
jgi:hypothetical protein